MKTWRPRSSCCSGSTGWSRTTRWRRSGISPPAPFLMNIRRSLPTLAENLKSQFGLIADQIVGINLTASRGASEASAFAPPRGRGADQTGDRNRDHADQGQARGGGGEEAGGGIGDERDVTCCRERDYCRVGSLDFPILSR